MGGRTGERVESEREKTGESGGRGKRSETEGEGEGGRKEIERK